MRMKSFFTSRLPWHAVSAVPFRSRGFIRCGASVTLFCLSFAYAGWEPTATDKSPLFGAVQAYRKGDYAAALKACQWHRTDAKTGPEARLLAGMCMLKAGNTGGALREWKSVRDSWPTAPESVAALALEIDNTPDAATRAKLEGTLLTTYADAAEAKALLASREKAGAAEAAKLTPDSELEGLLKAGKREEAAKFLISTARRASGEDRDRLIAQLATLYESTGDWRKAAGAWRKIAEEGNAEYREAATFDWIRTTAAIGKNADGVEAMWKDFLRDYPASNYSHLAVTRLAEMMISQRREAEAAVLMDGWLKAAEGKSADTELVAKRLADLHEHEKSPEGAARTTFAKDRQEAIAKLPAELAALAFEAKSGKSTGKMLNRIRDIRRGLAGSDVDAALMLELDRTEALALHGLRDPRRALGLLEDSWKRNPQVLASKESAILKAALAIATDALGIALEAGNDHSVVIWSQRAASETFPAEETTIRLLKESAIRLILADAKSQGIDVLSLLGDQVLARFPDESRIRIRETATVARLKNLCARGTAVMDDEWFVSEIPTGQGSAIAKALFEGDLLFAARETEEAARAYAEVTRRPDIDRDTEGYATLQWARALAALGKYEEALRTYKRFEDKLGATESAAPALIRAGTLCGGPMNDARGAKTYFNMVSTRYPASPEAELCDWYTANLLLWEGDLRASRTAFDEFEKKYPQNAFLPTLQQSIRPQL